MADLPAPAGPLNQCSRVWVAFVDVRVVLRTDVEE